MKLRYTRAFILIVAVIVLMVAGITTAAILGSVAGIIAVVTIGTLVLSYTVRHEARSTYVYHRGG